MNMLTETRRSTNMIFFCFFALLALNCLALILIQIRTINTEKNFSEINNKFHFIDRLLELEFNLELEMSELDSPANDIFENHDLVKEKNNLKIAYTQINKTIHEMILYLQINDKENNSEVIRHLHNVKSIAAKMNQDSLKTFYFFRRNDLKTAAKKMAFVDQGNAEAREHLITMRRNWSADIKKLKDDGFVAERELSKISTNMLLINFLVSLLLIIIGLYVYLKDRETNKFLNFYKNALDKSTIVAVTDLKGKITYANDAFTQISGYSQQELLGKDHRLLNSKFHPKSFFIHMWKAIGSGQSWVGEIKNRRKDGSYYWVNTVISPMLSKKGRPEQFIAIRTDISKRKEYEEELVKAKLKAERASRIKSDFLANMSHEIRTPMNAIIGMAELLDETPLNDQQKKYVSIFKRAGENLLTIINDILDLSKIESGHLSIENTKVDLQELVIEVIDMCTPNASAKNLSLTFKIDSKISRFVETDALRIRQILMNLIGNAIKFTEKGSVSVFVGRNITERPGNILITVSDTGIGIAKEKQTLLFQAFTQADSGVTKKYGGTGLGLAISKKLTEMMGGNIWIESELNMGTKFSFTLKCLPILDESISKSYSLAPSIHNQRTSAVAQTNASLNILLVDDSEDNRTLIKEYLKKSMHSIVEAENGQLAVDLFKQRTFDVVLMDIQMPVMDGYTAVKLLRNLEQQTNSTTPIIALTAYALKEEQDKCLAAGFDSHIAKPIKKAALISLLNQLSSVKQKPTSKAA